MKYVVIFLSLLVALVKAVSADDHTTIARVDYQDRVNAIWHGQMIAVLLTLPFEHKTASVEQVRAFPKPYLKAFVDDDWYYEICAVRAFEKLGVELTAHELGLQWLENSCGSYGSSKVALANLRKGIAASESGHPRYNRLWWTIGPVFSADLYGALAPGMPNEAGRMARQYCALNGYGESLDGAVLYAGAISLGFIEKDVRSVLRRATVLIDASSPYRQCVESVVQMAESGRSFEEIVSAIEDRWRVEYPASNNAVANGGLTAACLWFGDADFWKTIDLACRAADFSDTDNSAATAVAVIAAMKGMDALPRDLVEQLNDRVTGATMGGVELTPPVDERISDIAKRTAGIGEKIVTARGGRISDNSLMIATQEPVAQPSQRFKLNDLMAFWNPEWTLERAGFGGDGVGAMPGIRGFTALDGDTLITYPRDEARSLMLRRSLTPSRNSQLEFQVGADKGKAWELNVFVGNDKLVGKLIQGGDQAMHWETISVDISTYANREVTIRLYQRVLFPGQLLVPGNAYWKSIILR